MNIVDKIVKDFILDGFTCYQSRFHVLNHIVLCNGTGYSWQKLNDGLYHLVGISYKEERQTSIELLELEENEDVKGLMNVSDGKNFYNHIATWVTENIDEYCKASFYTSYLDLKPKKPEIHVSRGYNRLCDMPKIEEIHPDWRSALEEIIEEQFELFKYLVHGYDVMNNRKNLSIIRHRFSDFGELYCILLNAQEKFEVFNKEKREKRKARMTKIYGTEEEKYNKFKHNDLIDFEEYKKLKNKFLNSNVTAHLSLAEYVKETIETKEKYFPDNVPNDLFLKEAMEVLENCSLLNIYFQEGTMTSEIVRTMRIADAYEQEVKNFVSDKLPLCIAAS